MLTQSINHLGSELAMTVQAPPPSLPESVVAEEHCAAATIDGESFVFRDEAILGTRLQINLLARNHEDALWAAQAARLEIDRLNAILNSRDSNSELAQLNRSQTHQASPELFAVVAAAERWREHTSGAFSGRLGTAIALWRDAHEGTPSRSELTYLTVAAESAQVRLDSATRIITRPHEVEFALDALAKGWIVDRAFEVARAAPGVIGALVNIGGDIRCGGRAPNLKGWCVGIPDADTSFDNAPIAAATYISDCAIATSGRGPRDRFIDGAHYSATLSPRDGWPIQHTTLVTAVGACASDADALATTLLALPTSQAIDYANSHNIAARIATRDSVVITPTTVTADSVSFPVRFAQVKSKAKEGATTSWPKDWIAHVTFIAPPRQLVRDQHFRSPYMAMWITDADNKRIRTLFLVGREPEWQRDNFIWWSTHSDTAETLVATRSMSTSGSGIYKFLWDGTDDQYQPVPGGTYVLHVETSRERGKHTHRSLTLNFAKPEEFTFELPSTEEAGRVHIHFHRP